MRIWDIDPGYLNDRSLLGEHRELHGILSIITNNKKGYCHPPETVRWRGPLSALRVRHLLLRAEMGLRGFQEKSPAGGHGKTVDWPDRFIDEPVRQFILLGEKYADKQGGRIPLPNSTQALWAQHKYSVMARDYGKYETIGVEVARLKGKGKFGELCSELVNTLRIRPPKGQLRNALQHLWAMFPPIRNGEPNSGRAAICGMFFERYSNWRGSIMSDISCIRRPWASWMPGLTERN